MRVYHSNRLEVLAGKLAGLVESEPSEPFTPERIVVPHQTMGRWLRLEIARELGIAANIKFELPAEFAWSILRGAVPDLSKSQGFAPAALRWHIFELLPDFARTADAAEVGRFLDDGDERKRFELADKLAGIFDRCVNFRGDWIRDWEQGKTPHWQARLWQLLAKTVSEQHWVHALDAFNQKLKGGGEPEGWPRRAFIFGISAFSPSYLQLLKQLGEKFDLHVFLLNPSSEYWADLRSKKEIHRLVQDGDATEQHYEEGNKLLAAWGRAGRFTYDNLIAEEDEVEALPWQPEGETRLAAVQIDILEIRNTTDSAAANDAAADCSLQIHCCHSPMREAEVLHDRLLDLLAKNISIEPSDIMILTPDLARYGPAIAAVFEAEGRIPVRLSRFRSADSSTAQAFLDLLSLPASGYGIDAVLAPLEASALRTRFDIRETSLAAIREWVHAAGIRRGVEAGEGVGSAPIGDHTWREGLRRLLMGYAVGDRDELVSGVASVTIRGEAGFEAGGVDFATLGRFMAYCELAFALRSRLAAPRPAAAWAEALRAIAGQFFDDGSKLAAYPNLDAARLVAEEFEELRALLDGFQQQFASIKCRVSFDVVAAALKEGASEAALGPARLADGASIGNLKTGQIPPAAVVCVVGMNGGDFPRNPHRYAFDPFEMFPRRAGDRDARQEDRFAFLEALLAARTAFVATYTGRNQSDDAEMQPSVVLEELLEYLAGRFLSAKSPAAIEHPLQPFSPRYFEPAPDNPLFSYSPAMLQAAKALRGGVKPAWRWSTALPEAPKGEVALAELEQFFASPAQALLRERFGVRLRDVDAELDQNEPLQIDNLEKYHLRAGLIERGGIGRIDPFAYERLRPRARASGALPHGGFGELIIDDAEEQLEELNKNLEKHPAALEAEPVRIEFETAGFRVAGYLSNIGKDNEGQPYMVWWRNGKQRAIDLIKIHLRQLAWRAAGNPPLKAEAFWLDKTAGIPSPSEIQERQSSAQALQMIEHWLEARWRGLSAPLPFAAEPSLAYVKNFHGGKTGEECLAVARSVWRDKCDDPQHRLLWDPAEGAEPISKEFQELSIKLLRPLL